MGKTDYNPANILNMWETHLLYERYKQNPNTLCEGEKRRLIDGLAQVIQDFEKFSLNEKKINTVVKLFKNK